MTGQQAVEAVAFLVRRMEDDSRHVGLTGISSDAMIRESLGGDPRWANERPWDRADWRRCLYAYGAAPLWLRERMRPIMREYRSGLQTDRPESVVGTDSSLPASPRRCYAEPTRRTNDE